MGLDAIIVVCHVEKFIQQIQQKLLELNPGLTVYVASTSDILNEIAAEIFQHARLIGFTTTVIVPPRLLEATRFGCYNFHPGPPEYPGWAPMSFATYEGASTFGVTAHRMTQQVDAGEIVGVDRFPVRPGITHDELVGPMVGALWRLFDRLAPALARDESPLPSVGERWGSRRYTRRMAKALCRMTLADGEEEIVRRVRAFGSGWAECRPSLSIGGFDFPYSPEKS